MFNILKFQIYPEVNGIVTMNGEPVEGAVVKRFHDFRDKEKTCEYITKKDGEFHFPETNGYSLWGLTPFENRTHQIITINFNHAEYTAWRLSKSSRDDDPALSKILSMLCCELTNEEVHKSIDRGNYLTASSFGLAHWNT